MMTVAELPLHKLLMLPELQSRASIDREYVGELVELLKADAGFVLPPVEAVDEKGQYLLWDGAHRCLAYREAERPTIYVKLTVGTKRDAQLLACGANHSHGLRRTYADKERAVLALLNDPSWAKWNDCEIARRCVVNRSTVRRVREQHGMRGEDVRLQVNKYGHVAELDVSALTRRAFDAMPEKDRIAAMQKAEADAKARAKDRADRLENMKLRKHQRQKLVQVVVLLQPATHAAIAAAAKKANRQVPGQVVADLEEKYG